MVDWVHYVFTEGGLTVGLGVCLLVAAVIYVFGTARQLSKWWLKMMLVILTFVLVRTFLDGFQSDVATIVALAMAAVIGVLMAQTDLMFAAVLVSTLSWIISTVFSDERIQLLVLGIVLVIIMAIYFKHYERAELVIHHVAVSVVTSFVMVTTGFFFYEKAQAETFTHSVQHLRDRITCMQSARCPMQLALIGGLALLRLVLLLVIHKRTQAAEVLPTTTTASGGPGLTADQLRAIVREEYAQLHRSGAATAIKRGQSRIDTRASQICEEMALLPSVTRRDEPDAEDGTIAREPSVNASELQDVAVT